MVASLFPAALMTVVKLVEQLLVLKPKHTRKVLEVCHFGGHLEDLSSNVLLPRIPGFLF